MRHHDTLFTYNKSRESSSPNQQGPPSTNEKQKLHHLMNRSQTPLLEVTTVFPFDLFPDTIVIDATKVHIIDREFFFTEEIHSIPIKNIVDIYVDTGPFFATLRILPQLIFQNQITQIPKLWKSDAMKARDVIQGLILATKENINVTNLPDEVDTDQLQHDLQSLGRPQPH